MIFGHNFRLGGPIDTRFMRLNCILQDLFRDTPLDHIWHAQIRAQIRPNTPNIVFGVRIWDTLMIITKHGLYKYLQVQVCTFVTKARHFTTTLQ